MRSQIQEWVKRSSPAAQETKSAKSRWYVKRTIGDSSPIRERLHVGAPSSRIERVDQPVRRCVFELQKSRCHSQTRCDAVQAMIHDCFVVESTDSQRMSRCPTRSSSTGNLPLPARAGPSECSNRRVLVLAMRDLQRMSSMRRDGFIHLEFQWLRASCGFSIVREQP